MNMAQVWASDEALSVLSRSITVELIEEGTSWIPQDSEPLARLGWRVEDETWDCPYSLIGYLVADGPFNGGVAVEPDERDGVPGILFTRIDP